METIEERAGKWGKDYPKLPSSEQPYTDNDMEAVATNSYLQGATKQKAIDDKRYEEYLVYMNKQLTDNLASQRKSIIDKACDWLLENANCWMVMKQEMFVQEFRKAIEE